MDQIVFSIAGHLLQDCSAVSGQATKLPAVAYERRWDRVEDIICLFGFLPGELVNIWIFDPRGNLVATIPKTIQELYPLGRRATINTISVVPVPNHAPAGQWVIKVTGTRSNVEGYLTHPSNDPGLTLNKSVPEGSGWLDPRRLKNLVIGDTLVVSGVNYARNQDLPVAIYSGGRQSKLLTAQTVSTDRFGDFVAGFSIDRYFSPGRYQALVVLDPNQEQYGLINLKDEFRVFQPTRPCPGAMPTILKVGDRLLVSAGPPNNVREKAGVSQRKLGVVYAYEELKVNAGPKCADGMVWWKVYSLNTGMDGWTAEGINGDYWLSLLR
jgi:hypothetical protein